MNTKEKMMNKLEQLTATEPAFVAEITAAQIDANKGWQKPPAGLVDTRVIECPSCGSPGMNTCWGYWAYSCGATVLADGQPDDPCPLVEAPKDVSEIVNRRFGSDHEQQCKNPNVKTCAMWKCQSAGTCQCDRLG